MFQNFKKIGNKYQKSYYRVQKRNLLFPNEKYIHSSLNINKADLHRFKFVHNIFKNQTGSMLDIGCNDGYFMRRFPWKFDTFLGLDMFSIQKYTNNLFSKQKKRYTLSGKISYITGLFEEIHFQRKFDFVFAGEIIEHVRNPDVFLNHLVKVLKPNSVWCITTPDNIGIELEEHNRQFTDISLYQLLQKYFCNIHIVHLKSPGNSWPFLIATGDGKRISITKRLFLWSSQKFHYLLRRFTIPKRTFP